MNATDLRALLARWAGIMADKRDWLIELDSVVGDSDLGLTMSDGFRAASEAANACELTDVGKLCYQAGKAMATAVPSTMGTLMASGLMNAGKVLKGMEQLTPAQEAQLFEAYLEGVKNRGKAELGDKTFLDGLAPAVQALAQAAQAGPIGAKEAQAAADAAWQAFENTRGMLAKHGRMAIRGEASRELLDPGAAVAALLMKGYAEYKADSE